MRELASLREVQLAAITDTINNTECSSLVNLAAEAMHMFSKLQSICHSAYLRCDVSSIYKSQTIHMIGKPNRTNEFERQNTDQEIFLVRRYFERDTDFWGNETIRLFFIDYVREIFSNGTKILERRLCVDLTEENIFKILESELLDEDKDALTLTSYISSFITLSREELDIIREVLRSLVK